MENLNTLLQNAGSAACIDSLPLAMAYTPLQRWEDLYDAPTALERGTIFRALDKPFLGKGPTRND